MTNTNTLGVLAALLCAALVVAIPARADTVKGNGVIRTQTREASGFTSVGLGLPARLELRQGDTESVTVEADENLLPLIETQVKHGELEIKTTQRNTKLDSKSIRIVVQARRIEGLAVGGSGSITADQLRSTKLSLDLGGTGLIEVKRLEADSVNVSLGGSGSVKLAGSAKRVEVSLAGSGDVVAPSLAADAVEVSVAGSGSTQVAAKAKLDVTIAGSGSVTYTGDPVVKKTIVGSGRVTRSGG